MATSNSKGRMQGTSINIRNQNRSRSRSRSRGTINSRDKKIDHFALIVNECNDIDLHRQRQIMKQACQYCDEGTTFDFPYDQNGVISYFLFVSASTNAYFVYHETKTFIDLINVVRIQWGPDSNQQFFEYNINSLQRMEQEKIKVFDIKEELHKNKIYKLKKNYSIFIKINENSKFVFTIISKKSEVDVSLWKSKMQCLFENAIYTDCKFVVEGETLYHNVFEKKTTKNVNIISIESKNIENHNNNVNKEIDKRSIKIKLQILCHRSVLAAFSSVFNAMFEHKFKENIESTICIGDCSNEINKDIVDPWVMYSLINYIYCKSFDTNIDLCPLFALSDRFQISCLSSMCLQQLQCNINVHNVSQILAVTKNVDHMKMAIEIKEKCIRFIATNLSEVVSTSTYKNLISNDLVLMNEILNYLSKINSTHLIEKP